ncbi:hypothetical protein ACO03V_01355 [Microbacterium sp. HMH0099]|uniref:hypothetical protein n=1 Tax=Microbacterium sp. HMH0099 TaxID=3414026 RepID=UPI003BF765DB
MEQEIAALVPAEAKGHIDQNNTGPLLSCRREGDYSWTGRTVVALLQPVDIDALLDAVRNHFLGRTDYVAEDRPFHDGRPRTSIRGADGESYFVHMSHDSQRLEINSFSPCFALSQGLWPGGIY